MLSLLLNYKKQLIALLAALSLLASGYYLGSSNAPVQERVIEKIVKVEVEKVRSNTQKETHIIKKKDGTEETVISEKTQSQSETISNTNQTTQKDTSSAKKYRAGAKVNQNVKDLLKPSEWRPTYSVEAGVRAVGSFWVEGQYNLNTKELGLGLSVEF